jgi:hypothetical protein
LVTGEHSAAFAESEACHQHSHPPVAARLL